MCGGVYVFREMFDVYYLFKDFLIRFKDVIVQMQLKKVRFIVDERNCFNQFVVKFIDFDIILIFRLLRIICNLMFFVIGWDKKLDDVNYSFEVDLVWIKYYCNLVYGYNQIMEVLDFEFC